MISHLGRYEISDELGRGAMGIVYKAYDPLIERFVAIKTISLEALSEKERTEYEARFYQEAKAAGHLNHPNIVTIHDLGESGDVAYIAMELMEGRELLDLMEGTQPLPVIEALNIAIQVAAGLSYAHQRGIVHRDIKPSNIMVLGDNHVKIADFGIARMTFSLIRTQQNLIIGSPSYMSPEQIQGKPLDSRSDLYSLGVVLFSMLTGRLPFSSDNVNTLMFQIVGSVPDKPSALNPEIPEALDIIVAKCLAKKPDDRYAKAGELADALRACRDALLHESASLNHHVISKTHFKSLKRLVAPGGVSQSFVTIGSYLAIIAIFIFDVITPSTIQMHLLYIFPLIMISFHCERASLVKGAVVLSLVLEGLHLVTDAGLPIASKIILAVMISLSNIIVAYVSRIARTNFFEVEQLASFDRLTGLRNRLSFETITDIEIDRQKRQQGVFSFAYIDLDKFKELNESSGHAAGDDALKLIAHVIRENVRQFDTPARIGGDEFAILMPNTGEANCASFCGQIAQKIAHRMTEAALPFTISIGHATFPQAPVSISEVFHKAEAAMHKLNKQPVIAVCD